jgi:hypothetical protein
MTTRRGVGAAICWILHVIQSSLPRICRFLKWQKYFSLELNFQYKKVSKHFTVVFVFCLCRSCTVFYFKQLLTVSLWSNMTLWFLDFLRNLPSNPVWTFKCVCTYICMPSVCLVVCIYSYMIVVTKGRNLVLEKKKTGFKALHFFGKAWGTHISLYELEK